MVQQRPGAEEINRVLKKKIGFSWGLHFLFIYELCLKFLSFPRKCEILIETKKGGNRGDDCVPGVLHGKHLGTLRYHLRRYMSQYVTYSHIFCIFFIFSLVLVAGRWWTLALILMRMSHILTWLSHCLTYFLSECAFLCVLVRWCIYVEARRLSESGCSGL